MAKTIDLRECLRSLPGQILESIGSFIRTHSNTPICTVSLWGDAFHGSASLHLDTAEHSAAHVARFMDDEESWPGTDRVGFFCNNSWDMAHCVGEFEFEGYPNLYETDPPIEYVTLDGSRRRVEEESNRSLNEVVFPALRELLKSLYPFSQLHQDAPFRAGVKMQDSRLSEYDLLDDGLPEYQ